ncbi:LysE family translocator [Fluviibacterium sp. S390]|uniref:LysE family translocator n=1 Tax=Fluviibacterium sp. S390 TaxID=3415139 RepID=UPI003C7A720D
MTLVAFLTVATLHLLAAISPGPAFVMCLRVSVAEGFRPAVALSLGMGLGATLWAFAALAGLAVLFEVLPMALTVLRFAGAAFLIWLAVMMWTHARTPLPQATRDVPVRGSASAFRLGIMTQLANPKPAVFFGAVFVGLVPGDTALWVKALLLAVVFLNEALWYIAVSRLMSGRPAQTIYRKAKAHLDRLFGGLMAALAVKLAAG